MSSLLQGSFARETYILRSLLVEATPYWDILYAKSPTEETHSLAQENIFLFDCLNLEFSLVDVLYGKSPIEETCSLAQVCRVDSSWLNLKVSLVDVSYGKGHTEETCSLAQVCGVDRSWLNLEFGRSQFFTHVYKSKFETSSWLALSHECQKKNPNKKSLRDSKQK